MHILAPGYHKLNLNWLIDSFNVSCPHSICIDEANLHLVFLLLASQALDLKPNYVRAWANMGISYANQVCSFRQLCNRCPCMLGEEQIQLFPGLLWNVLMFGVIIIFFFQN